MGVFEGRSNLGKEMKTLEDRWINTKSSWDDAVSAAFEEKYMARWEADMRHAASAMDQMAILLSEIRRQCE